MKKVIYSFFLILFILPCYISADEYGITDSGKKVLLIDDGTWNYVKQQNKSPLEVISAEFRSSETNYESKFVMLEFKNNTDKTIVGAEFKMRFSDVFRERCIHFDGTEWVMARTDDFPHKKIIVKPNGVYKDPKYATYDTYPIRNPYYLAEIKFLRIAFEDGEVMVLEEE